MSSDTTSNDVHHWYMKPRSISSISSRFFWHHTSNINQHHLLSNIKTIKDQSISYKVIYLSSIKFLTNHGQLWSTMVNSAKMPRITWPPSGRGALGSVLKESRAARRSKSASMVLQALISSWTMGGHWEIIGYIIQYIHAHIIYIKYNIKYNINININIYAYIYTINIHKPNIGIYWEGSLSLAELMKKICGMMEHDGTWSS